jgi:hypothetical protein
MNDHLPKSYMALPHRPGPGGMSPVAENARYTSSASEMRPNGVAQTHRHLASYGRARGSIKNESAMSPMQQHVKPGPMISTKDLARDRSASSSGSSSPIKSAKSEGLQFCLCQPDPKIPRPRNGELMLSESLFYQHGKSVLFLEAGTSFVAIKMPLRLEVLARDGKGGVFFFGFEYDILANFFFGSFYSVSSTLAVARGGEKPWYGQPGDFQGHWRTVEAAFRGG